MSAVWDFLVHQVQTNQIAQAAIVAAPATAITYSLRAFPAKVYQTIKKAVSVDVRFNSDMADFDAIVRFVTKHVVYDKFSRNFTYQTETKWDDEEWTSETKHHGLTAGYGTHLGFYKRHLVIVERFLDDGNNTEKFKEHLVVTFITRTKQIVRDFTVEVAKAAGNNIESFDNVPVHINGGSYWQRMGKMPLRSMESVFSHDDAGHKLVDAIRAFEAKKEEHHRLGLPHHLGIMLHGEPGCGKSSLIHAAATELQRAVYYLDLGALEKNKELTSLFSGTRDWSKVIVAIEDIDAAGVKVSRSKEAKTEEAEDGVLVVPDKDGDGEKSPVSLSALLNVLDGILCPDGLVVIATTNHHDRLDPALVREGRFDHTVELKKLDRNDFDRMARLFGRDPATMPVPTLPMTGAAMRSFIMKEAA